MEDIRKNIEQKLARECFIADIRMFNKTKLLYFNPGYQKPNDEEDNSV